MQDREEWTAKTKMETHAPLELFFWGGGLCTAFPFFPSVK
jgi:hypothetical protein